MGESQRSTSVIRLFEHTTSMMILIGLVSVTSSVKICSLAQQPSKTHEPIDSKVALMSSAFELKMLKPLDSSCNMCIHHAVEKHCIANLVKTSLQCAAANFNTACSP